MALLPPSIRSGLFAVAAAPASLEERINAIALAPADDFRRDSDLFLESARSPEAQSRIQAAMSRGFQTREMEMNLARMVGDLA
jgi:hypothetical protein